MSLTISPSFTPSLNSSTSMANVNAPCVTGLHVIIPVAGSIDMLGVPPTMLFKLYGLCQFTGAKG